MNLYLKLFLGPGIYFGFFMGIFYMIQNGIASGVLSGITAGLFYGGFMSLILGFSHSQAVKRISTGNPKEEMGVHHIRNVKLQVPYNSAFDLCAESLETIKKAKVKSVDPQSGTIDAKVGMTWKTFGEVLLYSVSRIDSEHTQIEISSKPSVRTTLVDYGKNLDNVNKIAGFLNSHSKISA